MKQKTSVKDLTQLLALATAVINTVIALFDLLSKVVNYGRCITQLPISVYEFEGQAGLRSYR